MDVKERIYSKAHELFMRYGIASVTMDSIAGECGISKRTLYENVASKDRLLVEIMKYSHNMHRKHNEEISRNAPNRVIALLRVYMDARKELAQMNPAVIKDMRRLYPLVAADYRKLRRREIVDTAIMIEKGKAEGVFRADLNSEIAAHFFSGRFVDIGDETDDRLRFSLSEISDTYLTCMIRGIVTEKGLAEFERFKAENKEAFQ